MKTMQEKTNNLIDTHLRTFLLSIFLIIIFFYCYLSQHHFHTYLERISLSILTFVSLFSCSLVSDSATSQTTAHQACPPLFPRVCSNSCLLSQLCYQTISFSVAPFSSCSQSFPVLGSFAMSWPFTSDGQSIGASASTCLFHEYSGLMSFRIDWFDLPAVQGTLKYSPAQLESVDSSGLSLLYGPTLTSIHDYWTNHSFDWMDFVGKVMSLLFNTA